MPNSMSTSEIVELLEVITNEFNVAPYHKDLDKAIAALQAQGAEPNYDAAVGKMVSVDVSTCEEDAGHRIFAEIVEWQEDGQDDIIFLAINGERNHTSPPAQAARVPENRKLVPLEPTREMLEQAQMALCGSIGGYEAGKVEKTWKAMLNAAPSPAEKAFQDATTYGAGFTKDGKHVPYEDVFAVPAPAEKAVTLTELDAAFEREIERVSTLEYNSNEICRTFYEKLRDRLAPTTPQEQVDALCDHNYHYFGDQTRRRCNACGRLEQEGRE